MAATIRTRAKNIFLGVLREKMREVYVTNITSLNTLNFLETQDTQVLKDKNERAYGDLMQTLDLEIYRVVSNSRFYEFDPCAATVFETVFKELRIQNK